MHINRALARFLARHDLRQTTLAEAVGVSRETVNRWIRRGTLPAGANLVAVLEFARAFEPSIRTEDLFGNGRPRRPRTTRRRRVGATRPPWLDLRPELDPLYEHVLLRAIEHSWGSACPICRLPWHVPSEHLPLALVWPGLGRSVLGDVCEACAVKVGIETPDFRHGDGPVH